MEIIMELTGFWKKLGDRMGGIQDLFWMFNINNRC